MGRIQVKPRYTCDNCKYGDKPRDVPCTICSVQDKPTEVPRKWEPIVDITMESDSNESRKEIEMISIRWRTYSGRDWHTEVFATDMSFVDWLIINQAEIAMMQIERD